MSASDRPRLVVVCGSRTWTDRAAIRQRLLRLPAGTVVLHGGAPGAPGADRLAGTVAAELGLRVEVMRVDWARYGRAAGPRRNLAMLDRAPDLVIAFATPSLEASRGTRNTVQAEAASQTPSPPGQPTPSDSRHARRRRVAENRR